MAFWNRKQNNNNELKLNNSISVNSLNDNVRPYIFDWYKNGRGKWNFARFFINLVMNKIYQGMQNVTWESTEINYLANDIANFIDRNANLLINSYWYNGFMCIIVDKETLRLPRKNELRFDTEGRIVNRDAIVIYSDYYSISRQTHISLIKPVLHTIDSHANNSLFASDNLGALGIISGGNIPISPAAKEELQQHLRKDYGVGDDQFNFILSNGDLKYQSIDLKLKELDFSGNIKTNLEYICHFFNVPVDFVFGNSTYANQEQAILVFYQNAIMPLAEILLKLARTTFIYMDNDLKPSTVLTYHISNISQLNNALSKESNEKSAYLDLLMKFEQAGINVTEDIEKLYQSTKKMLTEV